MELVPECAGPACCAPYCDLELGDEPCAALPGTICLPLFEPGQAPPGLEQVGLCATP